MRRFRNKGGWWVVGQGVMFGWAAVALWSAGSDDVAAGLLWGGILVAVTGLGLAGDGVLRIRRHITALPAPVAGAPLVEDGSYRMVRHPIYGGLVLAALGLSAARGSLLGVTAAVALGVFFFLKSRFEERLLATSYPAYEAYRERVAHRLIPWVI
jgi:protein-S-isoprenylcysteine O-methyltransferase Ste14